MTSESIAKQSPGERRRRAQAENTRFTKHMAGRFAEAEGKNFGAMEANGVAVVVVRAGTTKERDLKRLVEVEWDGHFDQPRPV